VSIEKSDDEKIPAHTEDYYEELACQEEEYLEEGVEKLRERELLVSNEQSSRNPTLAECLDEKSGQAAEELIVGDADDPPLNDEAIVEMLKTSKT